MITLITGGQRSGKSTFAESLLKNTDDVVYIATAENRIDDLEFTERIKKHRSRRNKNWRTFENYKNFTQAVGNEKNYLLDCVTNAVSRFMFEFTADKSEVTKTDFDKILNTIKSVFLELIELVHKKNLNLILVTNEVGCAIVPMDALSRSFVDLQGMTNSFLANHADSVYFCVSGIPIRIK